MLRKEQLLQKAEAQKAAMNPEAKERRERNTELANARGAAINRVAVEVAVENVTQELLYGVRGGAYLAPEGVRFTFRPGMTTQQQIDGLLFIGYSPDAVREHIEQQAEAMERHFKQLDEDRAAKEAEHQRLQPYRDAAAVIAERVQSRERARGYDPDEPLQTQIDAEFERNREALDGTAYNEGHTLEVAESSEPDTQDGKGAKRRARRRSAPRRDQQCDECGGLFGALHYYPPEAEEYNLLCRECFDKKYYGGD